MIKSKLFKIVVGLIINMIKIRGDQLIGRVVISEETGRKFGTVSDFKFIVESGELLSLLITDVTKYAQEVGIEQDEKGRYMIPFSSVKSVGDFVIISERELV